MSLGIGIGVSPSVLGLPSGDIHVLGTLALSSTTFTVGTASSGTITGATAGSTITASGLPTGVTINSAARTWAYDGTGSATSGNLTLTETLAGTTNTPHATVIAYTVNAASGSLGGTGTLSAPVLDYPSSQTAQPSLGYHPGVDWQSGDVAKLALSASPSMSSPTILTHTITDADITAGSFSFPIPTLSALTYFQAFGSHSGTDSQYLSNMVAWGDTTAPVITTAATGSITETSQLAVVLAATDSGAGVPALVSDGTSPGWYISGGADQLQFQIAIVAGVPTLQWYNGYETYDTGSNSASKAFGGGNAYSVQITAIDYSGNASTPLSEAVTVTQIDQTPDAFSFTNVSNASLSTQYTSNTVTFSGLQAGFNIPSSVSTGFTYSKNGGTYQAAGSFTVQNGDTLTLRATSPSGNNLSETATVVVGSGATSTVTWTIATPVTTNGFDPAQAGANISLSNPNAVGDLTATCISSTTGAVRTVNGYSTGKHVVRFHCDATGGGCGLEGGSEPTNNSPSAASQCLIFSSGSFWIGATKVTTLAARAVNDTVDLAFDMDAKKIWVRINGAWNATSGDPNASGAGFSFSSLSVGTLFPTFISSVSGEKMTLQSVTDVTGFTSVI